MPTFPVPSLPAVLLWLCPAVLVPGVLPAALRLLVPAVLVPFLLLALLLLLFSVPRLVLPPMLYATSGVLPIMIPRVP